MTLNDEQAAALRCFYEACKFPLDGAFVQAASKLNTSLRPLFERQSTYSYAIGPVHGATVLPWAVYGPDGDAACRCSTREAALLAQRLMNRGSA